MGECVQQAEASQIFRGRARAAQYDNSVYREVNKRMASLVMEYASASAMVMTAAQVDWSSMVVA